LFYLSAINPPALPIGENLNKKLPTPRAFKRSPSLEISTWYKGILSTQLAGEADTAGAFDLAVSKMRKGTEPPPHIHSREHEFFYIFAGELKVYVEGQIFQVAAGDCMFLPKGNPHAFLIQSPEIHLLTLITPGGFMNAIKDMAAPAEKMEIPVDDAVTYATANLAGTMRIFEQYGVHLLTPEEIARQMPEFPTSLAM
jgi:mannose-6-phosphate isomerase-like protein (cupin superfamily)